MKFIATSNKVTASPVQFHGKPSSLQTIIERNPAFGKALGKTGSIIQQSSSPSSKTTTLNDAPRGLLSAVCTAYNQHHHLILRPDDVWQAILTQFSFYVNANAAALRDRFVDFDGKKSLVIMSAGNLFSYNFGSFAKRMVDEQISKNLKASVTDWLLPKFSTTRDEDRIVSAVTIMSTLQAYFEYGCMLACGIPTVTLEGTVEDWRLLRQKIDRLPQYDVSSSSPKNVMSVWHSMLSKVLDEFVKSKEGNPDINFWDTVCSHEGGGSGPSYLSGWVTVFACFNAEGKWKGPTSYHDSDDDGGGGWPWIDMDNLPVGAVSVPVTVDDNGTEYETQMVAGQMAYNVVGDRLDTIQPRSDWCIALDEKDAPPRKKSRS